MRYTFPCNIVPDDSEGGWGFVVSFPDIPFAHTGGKTFKETIILAEDCMVVALSVYVDRGRQLPTPSPYQKGQELLTVQPLIAAQLDLYAAMREQGITLAQLAERLRISEQDAAPLLHLDYCTPIGQVMAALEAMGRSPAAAVAEQAA
jgi:antitoxin HicB